MSRTRYYCLNLISVSLHSWRAFYIIYLLQVPWFLILYNLYLYFNVLQSLWHIFLMQKLFKKDQNCMYLPIVKCHSCHLHTKSLMPPSNFIYALCREKLFFSDWKCALICISDWNSISYFQNMGWISNQINEFCVLCNCFQYNESKVLIRVGFYEHMIYPLDLLKPNT